jgi:hypothetical protein
MPPIQMLKICIFFFPNCLIAEAFPPITKPKLGLYPKEGKTAIPFGDFAFVESGFLFSTC